MELFLGIFHRQVIGTVHNAGKHGGEGQLTVSSGADQQVKALAISPQNVCFSDFYIV